MKVLNVSPCRLPGPSILKSSKNSSKQRTQESSMKNNDDPASQPLLQSEFEGKSQNNKKQDGKKNNADSMEYNIQKPLIEQYNEYQATFSSASGNTVTKSTFTNETNKKTSTIIPETSQTVCNDLIKVTSASNFENLQPNKQVVQKQARDNGIIMKNDDIINANCVFSSKNETSSLSLAEINIQPRILQKSDDKKASSDKNTKIIDNSSKGALTAKTSDNLVGIKISKNAPLNRAGESTTIFTTAKTLDQKENITKPFQSISTPIPSSGERNESLSIKVQGKAVESKPDYSETQHLYTNILPTSSSLKITKTSEQKDIFTDLISIQKDPTSKYQTTQNNGSEKFPSAKDKIKNDTKPTDLSNLVCKSSIVSSSTFENKTNPEKKITPTDNIEKCQPTTLTNKEKQTANRETIKLKDDKDKRAVDMKSNETPSSKSKQETNAIENASKNKSSSSSKPLESAPKSTGSAVTTNISSTTTCQPFIVNKTEISNIISTTSDLYNKKSTVSEKNITANNSLTSTKPITSGATISSGGFSVTSSQNTSNNKPTTTSNQSITTSQPINTNKNIVISQPVSKSNISSVPSKITITSSTTDSVQSTSSFTSASSKANEFIKTSISQPTNSSKSTISNQTSKPVTTVDQLNNSNILNLADDKNPTKVTAKQSSVTNPATTVTKPCPVTTVACAKSISQPVTTLTSVSGTHHINSPTTTSKSYQANTTKSPIQIQTNIVQPAATKPSITVNQSGTNFKTESAITKPSTLVNQSVLSNKSTNDIKTTNKNPTSIQSSIKPTTAQSQPAASNNKSNSSTTDQSTIVKSPLATSISTNIFIPSNQQNMVKQMTTINQPTDSRNISNVSQSITPNVTTNNSSTVTKKSDITKPIGQSTTPTATQSVITANQSNATKSTTKASQSINAEKSPTISQSVSVKVTEAKSQPSVTSTLTAQPGTSKPVTINQITTASTESKSPSGDKRLENQPKKMESKTSAKATNKKDDTQSKDASKKDNTDKTSALSKKQDSKR